MIPFLLAAILIVLLRILALITPVFIDRYQAYKLVKDRERSEKAFQRQLEDARNAWKERHGK